MTRVSFAIVALFLFLAQAPAADPKPVPPEKMPALKNAERSPASVAELPIRFQTSFEDPTDVQHFQPTDPKAWKVVKQDGNHVFALTVRQSKYKPAQRSPYNIALIKDLDAGSVAIDVRMQSAMTDYGHRSLCLFFNYVDPSHFYYVHFGKEADPHANQIFIVDGADRKAISKTTTDGTPWNDEWHHARVVRNAETGDISVFFDDMMKPVMTANDETFASGQVGIGSFDDAGNFDEVVIYAPSGKK